MKDNLTEIVFLLDKSGSMETLKQDTIGGFNSFIEEQKKQQKENNDEVIFSTIFFDHNYHIDVTRLPIQDVPELSMHNYRPNGMTAYYDALGKSIVDIGNILNMTPENDRPSKVLFVVMTDGEENSSKTYNGTDIKNMIKHQEEKYNWKFIFMGANIDAELVAHDIGISNYSNFDFTPQGIYSSYTELSKCTSNYRSTGVLDQMPENIT